MRREGRVRGKPSNKTRERGRGSGKSRCGLYHDRPVGKSRQKRKGRYKRFAVNELINPSPADFCFQPSLKLLRGTSHRGLVHQELDERWSAGDHADEDAVQMGVYVATLNSVMEAAFARMHSGYGDDGEMDESTAMACTGFELASGAILAGDGTDIIPAIEEAFHRQLGIFGNAVEGSSFSETHFARKWGSVLSEESWSDVEFLESELENSEDEDWFMVKD